MSMATPFKAPRHCSGWRVSQRITSRACIAVPLGDRRWIYNLGNYTFDNGAGQSGYGQSLYHNVASLGLSSQDKCTHPETRVQSGTTAVATPVSGSTGRLTAMSLPAATQGGSSGQLR